MTSPNRWRKGFNRLSGFYDLLSKAVFWGALQRAQRWGTEHLPKEGNWLILGGGTGHTAAEMKRLGIGDQVVFVDISDKMVAKARKRVEGQEGSRDQTWEWVVLDARQSLPKGPFAGVALHFFLDLFPAEELPALLAQLKAEMAPGATFWVADFEQPKAGLGRFYAKGVTAVMYAFFRFCCGISGKKLPDIPQILSECGLKAETVHHIYGRMVFSGVWKLP